MFNRRFFSSLIASLMVGIFATEPIISYAQTDAVATDLASLQGLSTELDGEIILSAAEKKIWEGFLADGTLSERDKRLTNYILPTLAKEFGQIHVDILKDYATEAQQQSRLLATSSGISQRFFGKAASITSLGMQTCADPSTIFMRQIDQEKTLWLNQQDGTPNQSPFFGRSFDSVSREGLLLPLRSFTNRPTRAQTWGSLLQQIAKAEIEERFDLTPGVLANTPQGEMSTVIARARLARQLGLPELPSTMTFSSFYASLGQQVVEQTLHLPANSFTSRTDTRFWYETYQNIGFRVLEEELDLPDSDISASPFPATTSLADQPRFQLLAKRLEDRGPIYKDPVLALGLPTQSYLPTGDGSDIYNRLKNGDPDAFAALGAYYLGDSLGLSAASIATLAQSALQGENESPNLQTAHPLNEKIQADSLFATGMTINQREATLKEIGEADKDKFVNNLARVNGNVLLALTGSSAAPNEGTVTALFENSDRLEAVIEKLAGMSGADADYPDGFSADALQKRGEQILGEALTIDPADLRRLSDESGSAAVEAVGQKIDTAFDWGSVNGQSVSRLLASGQLTDRQMIEIGINQFWRLFTFPTEVQAQLNNLFLDNIVIPDEEVVDDAETVPDSSQPTAPTSDDNEITDDQTTDEVVTFAIPADTYPLGEALGLVTGIDAENLVPLLSGRFATGLKILTISQIARVLGEGSTITTPKLLSFYNQPSIASIEAVSNQSDAVFDNGFVLPTFFEGLKKSVADNRPNDAWQIFDTEITRHWNFDCPNQQAAAQAAINRLLTVMMAWPDTGDELREEPTRPVQIFTLNREVIADTVQTSVDEKYPTSAGTKWGMFSNPRNWDDLYIGY